MHKIMVFTVFSAHDARGAQGKTRSKTALEAYRTVLSRKTKLQIRVNDPGNHFVEVWGTPGHLLGAIWPAFERSGAPLGPLLGRLGRLWGASWPLLGASEPVRGHLRVHFGSQALPRPRFWRVSEVLGRVFEGFKGMDESNKTNPNLLRIAP